LFRLHKKRGEAHGSFPAASSVSAEVLKTVGGERGCSHVLELLHEAQDYTRSIFWDKPPDKMVVIHFHVGSRGRGALYRFSEKIKAYSFLKVLVITSRVLSRFPESGLKR